MTAKNKKEWGITWSSGQGGFKTWHLGCQRYYREARGGNKKEPAATYEVENSISIRQRKEVQGKEKGALAWGISLSWSSGRIGRGPSEGGKKPGLHGGALCA